MQTISKQQGSGEQSPGPTTPAATTYTYDNAGNLLSETCGTATVGYSYTADNQLAAVDLGLLRTEYTYYPGGLRKTKSTRNTNTNSVVGSIQYVWNGSDLVLEDDGTTATKYFYGLDLYGSVAATGTTSPMPNYYFHDAHGNVSRITSGITVTHTYLYDAFGNQLTTVADDTNPFRYCGEYYDSETENYYLRARYYDPGIGRFISTDPIKNGTNWYAYCSNDPVSRVDPSGLKDYIYTSRDTYYIENDWGNLEFFNRDRYFIEFDGVRYAALSQETATLYEWDSIDVAFLNDTLDSLIGKANEKETTLMRILQQSVGGDLDFKLQMEKSTLYLIDDTLYNRNEAGNFAWTYFLESKNISGYVSGLLAQGGSLLPPLARMSGTPRFDESWDRQARWAGVEYYYTRTGLRWLYDILYSKYPHI